MPFENVEQVLEERDPALVTSVWPKDEHYWLLSLDSTLPMVGLHLLRDGQSCQRR